MSTYEEEKAERKRLEKMSVEQLREELTQQLKEGLIQQIRKLPDIIALYVDNAATEIVAAAVGLKRDDWHDGKWEVDHGNSRRSAISDELGKLAMKQVMLSFPTFLDGLTKEVKPYPGLKKAMRQEYKEKLSEKMQEAIVEWAEEEAQKDATTMMKDFIANFGKDPDIVKLRSGGDDVDTE